MSQQPLSPVQVSPAQGADRQPTTRLLLVTGMSGAGKSSALKVLEDLGYEAVDNLPISLLTKLLATEDTGDHAPDRPIALGIDSRTRAFDAEQIVQTLKDLRDRENIAVSVLFLDCSGEELSRRFSETRRRHPLALDRPVQDGIARERELLAPLRRWADVVLDTTQYSSRQLRHALSSRFALARSSDMTLTIMSFGYARGIPRDADLVFDMRFLSNPHWVEDLRPLTGQDDGVGQYIEADPNFAPAFDKFHDVISYLLPLYRKEGKAYLTVAFGCTGGKHRSVFVAERMAAVLRNEGHVLSIVHRDLRSQTQGAEQSLTEKAESISV
ncbi:RNase adapter RapZ [Pedomonas mirosovicensis]|uniref:RNase adapter RapZ n=1 Tax=Pedomonas mirosovicensis TaxID=2908641 RepID=UPI00216702CD|nr:RNase adapter RapZ [Pedomonas mirosovicensis]